MSPHGGFTKRKLFPSLYIVALGLIVGFVSVVLGAFIGSADPADFSVQAKDRVVTVGIGFMVFGIAYFAACVLSVAMWIADKPWAGRALLGLALFATVPIALALVSIPDLPTGAPICLGAIIVVDAALWRIVYSPPPATTEQS